MFNLPIVLLLAASVAIVAWLVLTWYHADSEPVFGPASRERISFKTVVKNAFHDIVEITRPLWLRLWLNAPFAAVVVLDAVALLQEPLRTALVGNFYGGLAFVALNLIARYGSTPAHPPVAA